MAPSFPEVTDDRIEEWELVEESVETLFQLPAMRVRGAIRRYEDTATQATLADATDGAFDRTVRFFAATRLDFDPGLPPGTMPSMVLPSVRQEARRTFKTRLEKRGLADISRGRRERARVDGERARLESYEAVYPLNGTELPVTGWVGVWHGEEFYVVTGGYPGARLADVFGVASDPDGRLGRSPRDYRSDLLDLLQSVR
jgi:hypothetical protein